MKERGRGEPWHERCVLDWVPRPVPTPAQLGVGPRAAEDYANGQRGPREQSPAPRRREPPIVEAARDQRRDGEREGDGESNKTGVEQRRMDRHSRRLQQRIEAGAVERNLGRQGKRVGRYHQQEQEEGGDAGKNCAGPANQRRAALVGGGPREGERGKGRQKDGPPQQRSLHASPQCRERVDAGQGARRVVGHVRHRKVAREEGAQQSDRGEGREGEGGEKGTAPHLGEVRALGRSSCDEQAQCDQRKGKRGDE